MGFLSNETVSKPVSSHWTTEDGNRILQRSNTTLYVVQRKRATKYDREPEDDRWVDERELFNKEDALFYIQHQRVVENDQAWLRIIRRTKSFLEEAIDV